MRWYEIVESAESINTYLILLDINISKFEAQSKSVKQQYENNNNYESAIRHVLLRLNLDLLGVISNDELWSRFYDDSEISIIYSRFVELYNNNDEYLYQLSI